MSICRVPSPEFSQAADADVLVPTVTDHINGAMIETAGKRLGLIANFGAGIEHIDLAAARGRKIIVTNTPGVFTDDTADMAMALIIAVPRRLKQGMPEFEILQAVMRTRFNDVADVFARYEKVVELSQKEKTVFIQSVQIVQRDRKSVV